MITNIHLSETLSVLEISLVLSNPLDQTNSTDHKDGPNFGLLASYREGFDQVRCG